MAHIKKQDWKRNLDLKNGTSFFESHNDDVATENFFKL